MALVVEGSRFVAARWELSDTDFRRVLRFCTVLTLATAAYAFTSNEQGGSFSGLFTGPGAMHNAGVTGLLASTAFFRWLPMTLFFFVLAQLFNTRERIPWRTISMYAYRRYQQERNSGYMVPSEGGLNTSYPYFFICLFSAGVHPNSGDISFFWGQGVLIVAALWTVRPRRFGIRVWVAMLLAVVCLGFFGQSSVGALQRMLENRSASWLSTFFRQRTDPEQAMTAMGQIGKLKLSGSIVIRLHTYNNESPPTYLREASYRRYDSERQRWYTGSHRIDFENLEPETNQTTWLLLPGITNRSLVNIACYLEGGKALLPLPTGSSRLENLYAYILQKNNEGAVLAEGPGLVIFDAHYGPGATLDSPPDDSRETNRLDYLVPTNETPALKQVIAGMKVSGMTEEQTLRTVYGFFENNFNYSLWQGPDKRATTNQTPLARFLLTSRSGHCEYFASATVLLLRQLNIPARYAVGYLVHERSGEGYVVRERDAHAWCLVWNAQRRVWEDFDTTPASWIAQENKRAADLQWLSDFGAWLRFQIAKVRWGQSNLRQYILWGLVPVLASLFYQIVFRRGRQRQGRKPEKKSPEPVFWPGLDSQFYLVEKRLEARGLVRGSGQSLSTWLTDAMKDPGLGNLREPLEELLQLHYRYRFDPRGLTELERQQLSRDVKACLNTLSRIPQNG